MTVEYLRTIDRGYHTECRVMAAQGDPDTRAYLPESVLQRAVFNATKFAIIRYLMANTHGRWSGAEKAQRHRELCSYYVSTFLDYDIDDIEFGPGTFYDRVHSATQDLTDRLDSEIGFPLNMPQPDYDHYARKFHERFYELASTRLTDSIPND